MLHRTQLAVARSLAQEYVMLLCLSCDGSGMHCAIYFDTGLADYGPNTVYYSVLVSCSWNASTAYIVLRLDTYDCEGIRQHTHILW